jgi:hypothetical protein
MRLACFLIFLSPQNGFKSFNDEFIMIKMDLCPFCIECIKFVIDGAGSVPHVSVLFPKGGELWLQLMRALVDHKFCLVLRKLLTKFVM